MFVARALTAFSPSGILKSGTQAISPTNSYTQVTGWIADPAYPGSTVSSNALVVRSSGTARLSAAVAWSSTLSGTGTIKILKNGTVVITGASAPAATTGTATATGSVSVTTGDLISVQFLYGIFTDVTIVVSGTFVRAVSS